MSHEERTDLLNEIEEIRASIEKLQPQVYNLDVKTAESGRALLVALRKDLARDMEQLHGS